VALSLDQWTDLPRDAIQAVVRSKLRLVGLEGSADKFPAELSGGMKKRAAIARALALEPELIFLDEPSAGLDPVSAAELDELILTMNRGLGLTVVIVTHELDSIFHGACASRRSNTNRISTNRCRDWRQDRPSNFAASPSAEFLQSTSGPIAVTSP
jgi:ABC-type transporter Mla maintaining outer membrane lipid asymmetry ATPase subunit MlaF